MIIKDFHNLKRLSYISKMDWNWKIPKSNPIRSLWIGIKPRNV